MSQVAEQESVAAGLRSLTRDRIWINEQHVQVCRVAAPTFFEQKRAEWFLQRLAALGWEARLDRAGNVVGTFGPGNHRPLVLSAHLDTVLAPARPEDIGFGPDGKLVGPGVSDNGSGLAALLALARVLPEMGGGLSSAVALVANVGEEGEGNLNGMRYLCEHTLDVSRVAAFLVLDGPSTDHITAQALASRRFEISFAGPGGHSWNDHGTPNPVHALGEAISVFSQSADARAASVGSGRWSYNFGIVEGGTSINSIPASARAKLDVRSQEPAVLDELSNLLTGAVAQGLERENRTARNARLTGKIKDLGFRPGGKLPDDSALLRIVQAVDGYLNIKSRPDCASTDANIPLSLGVAAVSIGTGGQGGGAHTPQEWYQPEGREVGLKRILLILALLAQEHAAMAVVPEAL